MKNPTSPWKSLLLPLAVLAGALPALAVVDFAEWPNSVPIKLNTTASGANVATEQYKFPVLVKLTGSNFTFDQAKDDGSDLRFSRNIAGLGHQELPYHIERWDKTNKLAELWVQVDTVFGNDEDQAIILHWGHSTPPAATFPVQGSVFGTANNYSAVWHMKETGSTVADVASGFTGTKTATSPTAATGQIAQGQTFNGTSALIDFGSGNFINNAAEVTLEAWVAKNANSIKIVGVTVEGQNPSRAQIGIDAAGKLLLEGRTVVGEALKSTTSAAALSSSLTYVVGILKYGSNQIQVCVNGACETPVTVSFTQGTIPNSNSFLGIIGAEETKTSQFFNGVIDEVRISKTARSADWIKLCYENARTGQKFVQVQTQFLPMVGGVIYGDVDLNGYSIQDVGTVVTRKWRVNPPDYVFEKDYKLPSLASVEAHIGKKGHLPGVPSAAEMKREGVDLGTMNLVLLKQIEHLQLYILDQEKRIRDLEKKDGK